MLLCRKWLERQALQFPPLELQLRHPEPRPLLLQHRPFLQLPPLHWLPVEHEEPSRRFGATQPESRHLALAHQDFWHPAIVEWQSVHQAPCGRTSVVTCSGGC